MSRLKKVADGLESARKASEATTKDIQKAQAEERRAERLILKTRIKRARRTKHR